MGRRICLTEAQRRDEAARQLRLRVADGLALYKHRRGLTREELAEELHVSGPTVKKILQGEDVCMSLSAAMNLVKLTGVEIR